MKTTPRDKAFVSYSHKDKKLFEEFKTMLAPAIRDGLVDLWDDTKIQPGAKWKEEIQANLDSATIAVLLVSQQFLASDFIAKNELPPLLKAAQAKGLTVFWIYLSACLYEHTEIINYQAAHDISKPLDRLDKPHRQAVLSEICARLVKLAANPQAGPSVSSGAMPGSQKQPTPQAAESVAASSPDEVPPHLFVDKKVGPAAIALRAAAENKTLTMRALVSTLDDLFDRATFYTEPSIGECPTQEWGQRLHSAAQTLRLLAAYKAFVEEEAAPALGRYRQLTTNVSRYCERMAGNLFAPVVELAENATLVGTPEFIAVVNPRKILFPGGADPETCKKIDPYLQAANRGMKQLYHEFVGSSRRLAATAAAQNIAPPGTESGQERWPRVYISYSMHTKGAQQRIFKLAEKLRSKGIDARVDYYYRASLHGFAPPAPRQGQNAWLLWQKEQIQNADRALIVCDEKYAESPEDSGVAHDLAFMQADLESGARELSKFIPAGFGPYAANSVFVPALIRGAHYYDLSEKIGFDSLVRGFRTEFPSPTKPSLKELEGTAIHYSSAPATIMNTPNPRRSITWLHVSDLHYCKERTGWDAHRVLKPLVKDLQAMEANYGLTPQLLFFTGDAAFGNIGPIEGSTLQDQFDGAAQFLEGARASFKTTIPKENIFLVPGNHDVDREQVTADQTDWLVRQNVGTITRLIQKADKQWERFMDRLKDYREFLARAGYQHLLSNPKRLIYAHLRELHGIKIGIAGFNSAWTCGQDAEKGKLWLGGDWQSGELIGQLAETDFRLALIHHPFGWFVEYEDTALRILFEREFAMHLHGHEHLGWVDAKADGHVRIAAAASYDSSHMENGYNFVRLNLETGEGEVWLRRYDEHGGGWVPLIIAGKTNNDGLWRLGKLPWLQPFVTSGASLNPQ